MNSAEPAIDSTLSIGFIGLGRMGLPMSQLISKQHQLVIFDVKADVLVAQHSQQTVAASLPDLVSQLPKPCIIWLMIPAENVAHCLSQLTPLLARDDIVIDGGNSSYSQSLDHNQDFETLGINFVSVGCSGGLAGAENGPPMTVSCDPEILKVITPILDSLGGNYSYYPRIGFGHLAKGIHNAIEYGMMQSIAEGIALYFHYGYSQDEILSTFKTWSKGSIIESALVNCIVDCLKQYDFSISRGIKKSETVDILEALCDATVPTPCIDAAIQGRKNASSDEVASKKTMTTLALLRNAFGGHKTQ